MHIVNNQPSRFLVEVGVVGRDPKIHVDRREIGVGGGVCRKRLSGFIPKLLKRVSATNHARQRILQFLGDLQQQRTIESVMEKRAEPAMVVAVARPHGRIQAEKAHVLKRLFGEKVVQYDNAGIAIEKVASALAGSHSAESARDTRGVGLR